MRLLYIDDDRINTLLFTETCKLVGELELQCAASGEEASVLAREWQPDVLVVDLHLPDINGYQLLAQLRALPGLATTPAFMCSAEDPDRVQGPALQAGFRACWSKPVDLTQVLEDLAIIGRPA